jgi:hypothetical protein
MSKQHSQRHARITHRRSSAAPSSTIRPQEDYIYASQPISPTPHGKNNTSRRHSTLPRPTEQDPSRRESASSKPEVLNSSLSRTHHSVIEQSSYKNYEQWQNSGFGSSTVTPWADLSNSPGPTIVASSSTKNTTSKPKYGSNDITTFAHSKNTIVERVHNSSKSRDHAVTASSSTENTRSEAKLEQPNYRPNASETSLRSTTTVAESMHSLSRPCHPTLCDTTFLATHIIAEAIQVQSRPARPTVITSFPTTTKEAQSYLPHPEVVICSPLASHPVTTTTSQSSDTKLIGFSTVHHQHHPGKLCAEKKPIPSHFRIRTPLSRVRTLSRSEVTFDAFLKKGQQYKENPLKRAKDEIAEMMHEKTRLFKGKWGGRIRRAARALGGDDVCKYCGVSLDLDWSI